MAGRLRIGYVAKRSMQVKDTMRGRVMSLYTMSFLGAAPIAALLGGWLADHAGVKTVTMGSGLVLASLGLYGLSPLAEREPIEREPTGSSLAKTEVAG